MDLLIENDDLTVQLSALGVTVTDVKATNSSIDASREAVSYRNGRIFYGATYSEKKITITGYYYAEDEYDDQAFQDKLNGLLCSVEPYYISRMYLTTPLYSYERPGENKGFEIEKSEEHLPYIYRWRVVVDGNIDYEFQGRSEAGLLYALTINFITSDLPYGMTCPEDLDITSEKFIPYSGTAPCSQLEHPFVIELTSTSNQSSSFDFSLGNKKFTYTSDNPIKKGDVFELKGTSFLLNGLNINDKTNIEYFVLKPNNQAIIAIETTFQGQIKIINKVDFYL